MPSLQRHSVLADQGNNPRPRGCRLPLPWMLGDCTCIYKCRLPLFPYRLILLYTTVLYYTKVFNISIHIVMASSQYTQKMSHTYQRLEDAAPKMHARGLEAQTKHSAKGKSSIAAPASDRSGIPNFKDSQALSHFKLNM